MDIESAQQITKLNTQGTRLHLQGKLSKAEDCYRQALAIDPESATSHNNLGFLLAQQHQWKEALTHLHQAVELAPKNATFLSNLGQVLTQTGLVQDGLNLLLKAAKLEPSNVQVWENLGRLCLNLDDPSGAEIAWRQAWQQVPHDVSIIAELASCIGMQGRYQEAIDLYREALEIHPGYADAWVQLGVNLFLQEDYDQAREVLQKALGLDAANYSALRYLGYVLTNLGERARALNSFKTLLNYYPDSDTVRLDFSILLMADNQNQAACEQLEFLYKNNSHNDRVIFYYGLSLYRLNKQPKASEIWSALENSDSAYRQKIGEFVEE